MDFTLRMKICGSQQVSRGEESLCTANTEYEFFT